jgi:hypothetical protein
VNTHSRTVAFGDFFDGGRRSPALSSITLMPWMGGRLGKNSLNDTFRQLSGALILLSTTRTRIPG